MELAFSPAQEIRCLELPLMRQRCPFPCHSLMKNEADDPFFNPCVVADVAGRMRRWISAPFDERRGPLPQGAITQMKRYDYLPPEDSRARREREGFFFVVVVYLLK